MLTPLSAPIRATENQPAKKFRGAHRNPGNHELELTFAKACRTTDSRREVSMARTISPVIACHRLTWRMTREQPRTSNRLNASLENFRSGPRNRHLVFIQISPAKTVANSSSPWEFKLTKLLNIRPTAAPLEDRGFSDEFPGDSNGCRSSMSCDVGSDAYQAAAGPRQFRQFESIARGWVSPPVTVLRGRCV